MGCILSTKNEKRTCSFSQNEIITYEDLKPMEFMKTNKIIYQEKIKSLYYIEFSKNNGVN
jgi:hypothetical protein